VDFQTLDADERAVLEEVARNRGRDRGALAKAVGRAEEAMEPLLFGLRMMGYLAGDGGGYRLGNWFFDRWLKRVEAARVNEARP
jgi:hypothetical protein